MTLEVADRELKQSLERGNGERDWLSQKVHA